jgi:glucosamine--fructose-6-phosphate aminotransferase (isomerizing)
MSHHTLTEIRSQPAAWQQALERVRARAGQLTSLANRDYEQVIFTGCGSTYYLSLAAAALFQALTGRPARAVPGGELLLNSDTVVGRIGNPPNKTLLVAISRSGTTTETVRAVEQFKAQGRGPVIGITNYDTTLAGLADEAVIIPAGQEESVAQTRSFASMYVAATAFAAQIAGREDLLEGMEGLSVVGERLIGQYEAFARELGENLNFDRFYFLGSGARYGLACEVNLKMKEMTLTHSEPFHFLEFRHGPMSMVNERAVVVGMVSDKNSAHERKVLAEMRALGGTILSLAETDADVVFASGIPEPVRGVLYLPVLQLMAFYRALAKGLNPDRPANLTAVVKLDL